ncbi:MAG TPA: hypothetical protein PK668_11065 [Myxococcota bacterium]|nr:hypothetical protein [Myxococcota bacterium]HRY93295.1 hypothetical protein [Myxococcota bacterium]HSA20395.1 hypothetical protein [Myxococcota bacterium]
MEEKQPVGDPAAFEARVSAAGQTLGAFGRVEPAELQALRAGVRARLDGVPRPRARLALALSGLGLAAGLAVLAWLAPWRPAAAPQDVDQRTLALLDEVESIAYPGFARAGAETEEAAYEDQLASAPDWWVQGEAEEPGPEEYPGAYGWLDGVLSGEVDSEVL